MRGKLKYCRGTAAAFPRATSPDRTDRRNAALSAHQWTKEYVLALREPNDNVNPPLLQLFDARLIVMHHDGMRFIGIERPRGEDGPAYVQEWSMFVKPTSN